MPMKPLRHEPHEYAPIELTHSRLLLPQRLLPDKHSSTSTQTVVNQAGVGAGTLIEVNTCRSGEVQGEPSNAGTGAYGTKRVDATTVLAGAIIAADKYSSTSVHETSKADGAKPARQSPHKYEPSELLQARLLMVQLLLAMLSHSLMSTQIVPTCWKPGYQAPSQANEPIELRQKRVWPWQGVGVMEAHSLTSTQRTPSAASWKPDKHEPHVYVPSELTQTALFIAQSLADKHSSMSTQVPLESVYSVTQEVHSNEPSRLLHRRCWMSQSLVAASAHSSTSTQLTPSVERTYPGR